MRNELNECNDRSICNGKYLMANNWDFITREILKEKCNPSCSKLAECHRILDFLADKKVELALDLLRNE